MPLSTRALQSRPGRELQGLSGAVLTGKGWGIAGRSALYLAALGFALVMAHRSLEAGSPLGGCARACFSYLTPESACCSWNFDLMLRGGLYLGVLLVVGAVSLRLLPAERTLISAIGTALSEIIFLYVLGSSSLSWAAYLFWAVALFATLFVAYRLSFALKGLRRSSR